MSRIKAKDTALEKTLIRALKNHMLVGYKRNKINIMGKPDVAWENARVAVFCDSSFWHGFKNMATSRHRFKRNKNFWLQKIRRNMDRDKEVNQWLKKEGWKILRFWDFQIKGNVDQCVMKIKKVLRARE